MAPIREWSMKLRTPGSSASRSSLKATHSSRVGSPGSKGPCGPREIHSKRRHLYQIREGGCLMDSPTTSFHWGFILISVPNLLVIAGMIVLFAIALVAPFPHGGEGEDERRGAGPRTGRQLDRSCPTRDPPPPADGSPAAGSPALLRRVMGLCLRRDHDCCPGLGGCERRGACLHGAAVVARLQRRPLLQQPPLLVGSALLHLHGPASMGPVLHGRLAPRTRRHLGDRCGHLRGQHPDGIHRLSVAAELRLAVHRRQCQGRDEWGRCRRFLQCAEFRPDVRPAHHVAADRSDDPGGSAHCHGPRPRRRQTDRSGRGDAVMKAMGATQEEYYRGVRMVPYDLVKELVLALAGVGILALAVSAILSSPDVAPITISAWAQSDPVDFVTTATNELADTTTSAGYGNPYNTNGSGQAWGPIAPQKWIGTRIPIDSAK